MAFLTSSLLLVQLFLAQFKSDVGKIYAMGGFPRDAMRKYFRNK